MCQVMKSFRRLVRLVQETMYSKVSEGLQKKRQRRIVHGERMYMSWARFGAGPSLAVNRVSENSLFLRREFLFGPVLSTL